LWLISAVVSRLLLRTKLIEEKNLKFPRTKAKIHSYIRRAQPKFKTIFEARIQNILQKKIIKILKK